MGWQWTRRLAGVLGPLLALASAVFFFALADGLWGSGGQFTSVRNLRVVLVQTSGIAVAALGMTLVILSGGIDLSAGTTLALSATVLAWLLRAGHPIAVALGGGVLTGGLCGLCNGSLIGLLRMQPFIVTLGAMTAYLGLAKIIAGGGGTPIRPTAEQIPAWLAMFVSPVSSHLFLGLPPGVWLALLLTVVVWILLRYHYLGRYVFALGSNEAASRLCGLRVPWLKMGIYTLSGLLIGTGGVYQFSRLSIGDPTSGLGQELRMIAAVVVGGSSLSGGQGSVWGTVLGAAFMTVIANGCTFLGVDNPTQDIIIGGIIVAAIGVDRLRRRER